MTPYRDPSATRTAIARSPAQTRRVLAKVVVLGLACAGLTVVSMSGWAGESPLPSLGAALTGAGAVWSLLGGLWRRDVGEAACPECGATLVGIPMRDAVQGIRCAECRACLISAEGTVASMELATIADVPVFAVALVSTQLAWPPGCVVCGQPVAHAAAAPVLHAQLPHLVAFGRMTLPRAPDDGVWVRSGIDVTLAVPHCAEHDDGVLLTKGKPRGLVAVFRSWPYLRAFCELNDLKEIEAPGLRRG